MPMIKGDPERRPYVEVMDETHTHPVAELVQLWALTDGRKPDDTCGVRVTPDSPRCGKPGAVKVEGSILGRSVAVHVCQDHADVVRGGAWPW